MATAACHHGQAYGSIVLIDPAAPDDGRMGPVKRLTPDQLFPEAEIGTHGDPANYAAPWPLSESFFLCVYDPESRSDAGPGNHYGIYLVDAFGNKELLYRDPAISCLDPIPLRPRPVPPAIPPQTAPRSPSPPGPTGDDAGSRTDGTGIVGVANVYESLYALPAGTRVTHLRVVQLLPKTTPYANGPRIGYGDQKSARMVLGTVPVEADGSAQFTMPAGRPVYFQAVAGDGLAVQSMRSATYVHPGERRFCRGCHEPRSQAAPARPLPKAWQREPSPITPEVAGSRPFSFPILVQPVLEARCVPCHQQSRTEGRNPPDLTRGERGDKAWYASYDSLRPYAFFWDNAVFDAVPQSTPGLIGARAARLYQTLAKGHHGLQLTPEDLHRITLWLDCNSDFFGAYDDLPAQLQAQVVWPRLE